ncbi:hypothetical protein [Cupriavidus agavae]|nr:hypothetical protein [Cupriavidus agavae]
MPRAAPTDALTTAFAKLARIENTNTNQIVVVDGQLCASRMADAVQAAARAFPLLGVRGGNPAGSGSASHGLSLHRWKGRCNFGDVGFRRMLMALSRDNRLDWPNRPAFQIYLILASDGLSSCVYLTSAHAVADARSDCLLLARLMREYARLSAPEGCAPDSDRKQGMPVHEFASLQDILPSWYGGVARMRRLASAGRSLAQDLVRGDQGLRRRRRPGVPPAELDFFHSTLEPEFADTIARNARRAGVTMNTLFLAALVRLMERSGKRATTRLTCAVSLRYSLDPAYGESFRNYLLPVAVRTARGLGDADLLGHLQSAVRAARRPASLQRELGRLESLAASISMPWLDPVSRFVIARSQGTNACLSNPGRIAEDLSGFGPQHPTRQYTGFGCLLEPYDFIFYPPTVNGRLQWDVVFRRAAFTDIEREFVAPYRDALLALIRGIAGNVAPTSAGGGATGAGGQS